MAYKYQFPAIDDSKVESLMVQSWKVEEEAVELGDEVSLMKVGRSNPDEVAMEAFDVIQAAETLLRDMVSEGYLTERGLQHLFRRTVQKNKRRGYYGRGA